MIHRKLRMNSTNLSEESDAYSDGDDHVDVESGVEDGSPCNGIRHISDRLRGDAENNTKCVLHESRLHPTENLFKPNVFSRSPESVTTKPVTRPSFLITDILSDTKRDSETDSSVPNTPCTPTNILDINRSAALLAQRHPSVIQSPTTDRSESPCSDEESREGTPSSLSDEQHGLSSKSKKPRKARTAFTDHQLNSLEKNFERQKYLSVQDRMELAAKMGLSDTQVKTWYQNRRTKWKRQTAVGLELLAEAGNYATVQRMMQSSPYWSSYPTAPSHNSGLIDSLYYRQGVSPISSHRHMLSRMYLQGMSHIS